NFHFGFGLDLARRGHGLQNGPTRRFFRCHRDWLLALPRQDQRDDQKQQCAGGAKDNLAPATLPALLRGLTGKWGSGQCLTHGMIAYAAEAISIETFANSARSWPQSIGCNVGRVWSQTLCG